MFRKLTDRITSAASSAMSSSGSPTEQQQQQRIETLTALGFTATLASKALAQAHNNVDQAADLLFSGTIVEGVPGSNNSSSAVSFGAPLSEDADLQRAMQASLQLHAQQESKQQQQRKRSAAMNKAAQAALTRTSATTNVSNTHTLASHHPNVKLVPKLQDKTTEEQVLRCVDRMKAHYAAVDTLFKAFTFIRHNPDELKYRRVDTSSAGYQRSVAPAPGAHDLMRAMQFKISGVYFVLDRAMVDPALLYLGISALEQAKLTPEYQQAKTKDVFDKEVQVVRQKADYSEQEALTRANHLSKCPSEPPTGRGAILHVRLGEEDLQRRFDGDDTLEDVLHWLGAHGSEIVTNLHARNWSLVDRNIHPRAPIDCSMRVTNTLQYLGCWPSGKLEIVPSNVEWKSGAEQRPESRRGVGLGSRDV